MTAPTDRPDPDPTGWYDPTDPPGWEHMDAHVMTFDEEEA